jgi:predicted TPR repeat methyltransferase
MLATGTLSRAKGLYRDLQAAEIGEYLRAAHARWDLVVAADVFVYIAELAPIFIAVRDRLAGGGWFAFSVEASAGERVELMPGTGRYRHAPDAVAAALVEAGFTDTVREPGVIRHETGQPVAGELLLARVPG